MVLFVTLATVSLGILLFLPLLVLGLRRSANLWLALFVYAIASLAFADYCLMSGLYQQYPRLWGWFDWPVAAIGACFYCYVRSLTGLSNSWRQSFHFVPVAALLGWLLYIRWQLSPEQIQALLQQPAAMDPTPLLLFQLLAASYGAAVSYRLWQYRRRIRQEYARTEQRDLQWLQWLTVAVMLLLVLWFPAVQAGGLWLSGLVLARLGLLYAFGWFGLRQQQVFLPVLAEENQKTTAAAAPSLSVEDNNDLPPTQEYGEDHTTNLPAESRRYARSGMTTAAAQLISERLTKRMLQQDYLENDLTLTLLAQRIGTSSQLLSEYLNVELGQNFFDFINSQRVAQVQRLVSQHIAAGQAEPLLPIALAAGFNSKSTFNAAFRKHTGMAPSAWRKEQSLVIRSEPIGPDD